MSENLVSLLRNLAQIDKLLEEQLENKKIADEALKQTVEYYAVQTVQLALKELQEKDTELRRAIKEIAYDLSKATEFEDCKPATGVEIKRFETVEITDEQQAKVWLATNAPTCLSIKKSDTDKVLKVVQTGFSKLNIEYRAQIASDLSGYLDKEE